MHLRILMKLWFKGHGHRQFQTRSSATAKSTARPSCLVGVPYNIYRRQTTDQQLINHLYETGEKFTEFREITQNNGHYAVQGHSRSPILVPIESPYTTSYISD